MSRVVLVTGASGFLGHHVCTRLLAAGWSVRGAVRTRPAPEGVDPVPLDGQEDGAALRSLVRGCDAIVHLAGRAHVLRETEPDPGAAFRRSNLRLAQQLAEAATAEGVGTFLLMSSIAAVSNPATAAVSDASSDAPEGDYGRSKREAEAAVERAAQGTAMRVVALRPPMVYGEYMRGNPLRLFAQLARGLPVPAVRPPVLRSMMYAGNLAEAAAVTLCCPQLQGRFCVADQPPVAVEEFVRAAAAALQVPPRVLPVPRRLLLAAARAAAPLGRLAQPLVVDDHRFRTITGFSSPFGLPESLARTAAWHRNQVRDTTQSGFGHGFPRL